VSTSVENGQREIIAFRARLLEWAAENRDDFPWRADVTPYRVLVAELLLTRTRAESVAGVIGSVFVSYPDVDSMAAADIDRLAHILRPLGLHRKRAAMLVRCANQLKGDHGGDIPNDGELLAALPYVGRYAVAAIRSFAFGSCDAIVDTNVARVYRRVFGIEAPKDELRKADVVWKFAEQVLPTDAQKARIFNWGLLDLGRVICRPRQPRCERCPMADICRARAEAERPWAKGHRL
jgi:A/G-specific adenine glycosylase